MIYIGLGGNLNCDTYGTPRRTCGAALAILEERGVRITDRARWYESAPVPISDQPWFVNGVVEVATELGPESLVQQVLMVEAELGRRRSVPNAARTIDLDVLAYGDQVVAPSESHNVEIPHPRMHKRAFVIQPLAEIAPDWIHPVTGIKIAALLADLPTDQICRPMTDADGLYGTEWSND